MCLVIWKKWVVLYKWFNLLPTPIHVLAVCVCVYVCVCVCVYSCAFNACLEDFVFTTILEVWAWIRPFKFVCF